MLYGNPYDALCDLSGNNHSTTSPRMVSNTLQLFGLKCDVTTEVGKAWSLDSNADYELNMKYHWETTFSMIQLGSQLPTIYHNGQNQWEVLWRTMLGNHDGTHPGYPAYQQCVHSFRGYITSVYAGIHLLFDCEADLRKVLSNFIPLEELEDSFQVMRFHKWKT